MDSFQIYIDETYPEILNDTVTTTIEDIDDKVKQLVQMILAAKYCVFYTGAGVSTSSGLPDYRGPNGVWTKRKNGDESWTQDQKRLRSPDIQPSTVHINIYELVNRGCVKSVITTNIDGLHVASGLQRKFNLIELHGNKYVQECRKCNYEDYNRDEHQTNNLCPKCGAPFYDNILNFGQTYMDVPSYEHQYDRAFVEVCRADLIVVWGSSLTVPDGCDLVDYVVDRGYPLFIINKQKTPKDKLATITINADCEYVLKSVIHQLV